MCGIFACQSLNSGDVSDSLVRGLSRLTYRGYDSYGFAIRVEDALVVHRSLDELNEKLELPAGNAGIGHTRWATNGKVNLDHCHPYESEDGSFALVHNGVVENHAELVPGTESDTRVIAALIQEARSGGADPAAAAQQTLEKLRGLNSFVVMYADGVITASRGGPPLHVARSADGIQIASDRLSLANEMVEVFTLKESETILVEGSEITSSLGEVIDWVPFTSSSRARSSHDHQHFMLKELLESWEVLPGRQRLAEVGAFRKILEGAGTIYVIGAGGAGIAAEQVACQLREVAKLRALPVHAYEFDSVLGMLDKEDVVIALSQSGETADTLRAVSLAREVGCTILSHINMPESSLALASDLAFHADAGPEECVLSTKSAVAQVSFGYLLAKFNSSEQETALDELVSISSSLACLEDTGVLDQIRAVARRYSDSSHVYVLGSGQSLATARMAALNIKEASLIHAEAFACGELKHGVLALIDEGTPVLVYQGKDDRRPNVAAEVKARGGRVIGVGTVRDPLFDDFLPVPEHGDASSGAIVSLLPGQMFAYFIAVAKGINPDRPRNLAKSVTVL